MAALAPSAASGQRQSRAKRNCRAACTVTAAAAAGSACAVAGREQIAAAFVGFAEQRPRSSVLGDATPALRATASRLAEGKLPEQTVPVGAAAAGADSGAALGCSLAVVTTVGVAGSLALRRKTRAGRDGVLGRNRRVTVCMRDGPEVNQKVAGQIAGTVKSVEEGKQQTGQSSKPAQTLSPTDVFFKFMGALWESSVEVTGLRQRRKDDGGYYRKGVEGMSFGSLYYELLSTPRDSAEFKQLNKEYKAGWGFGFVDLTFQGLRKLLPLDVAWLTMVNFLQTLGLQDIRLDGIPVQNKWVDVVQDKVKDMNSEGSEGAGKEMGGLVKNLLSGKMETIAGCPMPVFLEEYGDNCGLYKITIGPRSVVVVSDPVVVKHILQKSSSTYGKGILSEVLEPIMGKGLIPADLATWTSRRKAIVPGFHKRWLKDVTSVIVDCADVLCDDLAASSLGDLVNMEEKFTSVSLDIIGRAVFDYDFGSVQRESPILNAVFSVLREAERRAQAVVPYWNLPGASSVFPDQKEYAANLQLLNVVLDELIANAMKKGQTAEADAYVSMLQYLVETRNEDVSTVQLRDDLMTLLIAGHETTAALLTWTLAELLKPANAEHLQKLQEEIALLEGRKPTYDELTKMPFMRNCLCEALRLYPAPPLLIRRCLQGDAVPTGPLCSEESGDLVYFLPGQDIFISTWSLQRNTKLWGEDAAEFKPQRWDKPIEGKGGWAGSNPAKANMYFNEISTDFAYVPFGGGPRKCVGDQFAFLEAQVVLVRLFQRFDMKKGWGPSDEIGMVTGATIHTKDGLLCQVEKKTTDSKTTSWNTNLKTVDRASVQASPSSVEQRIQPEALVIPTPAELRQMFTAQARLKKKMVTDKGALEAAYDECREITREYSKTFFLGSQLLGDAESKAVWAIYDWCRKTDELVDGPEAEGTTMEDLEVWDQRLKKIFDFTAEAPAEDIALSDTARSFNLIPRPFQDMVGGMAMDIVKKRYATYQELEVYCYRVAGTVGLMTTPVLGFDALQNFSTEQQDATLQAALSLGVALQLTNILRDVGEDARRGRIYVPLEDLERFGISEEEVMEAAHAPDSPPLSRDKRWIDFMEFQFERCESHYRAAEDGIIGLSEGSRLGVMVARLVYGGILDAVRGNGYDNFTRRAYVPFADKMGFVWNAWWQVQDMQRIADENLREGKTTLLSTGLDEKRSGHAVEHDSSR
eukprot:TRINITY_DN120809_c0_g1_i1.p1 TRINITY_DN120809_c0_g1~~TRINITY_DN120809_c0_g1_i1.p1  ORF type:complete len:1226 (-),score=316.77 TRINITY_DN120809_c0_g1_i1:165-3773(-)